MGWNKQPFCFLWRGKPEVMLSVCTVQSQGVMARQCVCLCLPITAALSLQRHHCNCLNCQVSQRSDNSGADWGCKPLWLSAAGIQKAPREGLMSYSLLIPLKQCFVSLCLHLAVLAAGLSLSFSPWTPCTGSEISVCRPGWSSCLDAHHYTTEKLPSPLINLFTSQHLRYL